MNESKNRFLPRENYFDALMERFVEPIGKATVFSITHEYFHREFMEFPINSVPMSADGTHASKNLYRHKKYSDLLCEIYKTENLPGQADEKMLVLLDFEKDKMIVASKYKINGINEGYPIAITNSVKSRLYQDYQYNAFNHDPFDTIDDLIELSPRDENILAHGDDYAPKNDHQRSRTTWFYGYARAMFGVKASSLYHEYAVPHLTHSDIICITDKRRSQSDCHSMMIGDVRDGCILDVYSNRSGGPIEGLREYFIDKRYMTPEEFFQFKNARFLIEKNEILRPNTILDLGKVDLRDKQLSENIDVSTVPAYTPQ